VPLHQLRGTHYDDPEKRRWVKSWVWRREHLWNNPGLIVASIGVLVSIVTLIAHWRGWFS